MCSITPRQRGANVFCEFKKNNNLNSPKTPDHKPVKISPKHKVTSRPASLCILFSLASPDEFTNVDYSGKSLTGSQKTPLDSQSRVRQYVDDVRLYIVITLLFLMLQNAPFT